MKVRSQQDDWTVELDLESQVLALDCPPDVALQADDLRLRPSAADLGGRGFVSAAELAAKAKAIDDAVMIAVERAVQRGEGKFPSKAALLAQIAGRVPPGRAAAVAQAACLAGGVEAPATPEARALLAAFLGDAGRSRPVGFYSTAPDLEAIFRQDRMLQEVLTLEEAGPAARTIAADPALASAYGAWMALVEKVTNPFVRADLRAPAGDRVSILPPSESPEGALVKRLFADRPIPEGFQLDRTLADAIRSGSVDLTPVAGSGWYDHVVWSLETLAAPDRAREASRLDLAPRYREHLFDLFKAFLALARETHVKQLECPRAGCGPPSFQIRPRLPVEPLATHYLRRALGYRFVRGVLSAAFGPDTVGVLPLPGPGTVASALVDAETLYLGAHASASAALGLPPDPAAGDTAAALQRFERFAGDRSSDPSLAQDTRMMVPVFFDLKRRLFRVWAMIGWTTRAVEVTFRTPPVASITGGPAGGWFRSRPEAPRVEWGGASYAAALPVTVELWAKEPLTREEVRRRCDEGGDIPAICARLGT